MPKEPRTRSRTTVRGIGWKKPIDAGKYAQVADAILASLTAEPIRFGELVARVDARLGEFDGSVAWYTICVVRELEVQGKVVRHAKPVRYAGATKARRSQPTP